MELNGAIGAFGCMGCCNGCKNQARYGCVLEDDVVIAGMEVRESVLYCGRHEAVEVEG